MRKLLAFAGLLACFACHDGFSAAMSPKAGWNPDDTAPTYDAVEASAARVRAERCRTLSCRGIEAVDKITRIADYVDDNEEMGTARILYSPDEVRRRLDRALLGRPDLYAPFCETATRILGRVPPAPSVANRWFVVTLLVAGAYVDLHHHGHCAFGMVTALPSSAEIDHLRQDAYVACENPIAGYPRSKVTCPSLVKGLPPD